MSTIPSDEIDTDTETRKKPPFLRRVRIRGYKSIGFCDVTLEPLTILVGRNASGKSNFLDALAFLRDSLRFNVAEAINRRGGVGNLLCRDLNAGKFSIEVERHFFAESSKEEHVIDYALEVPVHNDGWPTYPIESLRDTNRTDSKDGGFKCEQGNVSWFGTYDQSPLRSVTQNQSFHLILALISQLDNDHRGKELERMEFYNFHPAAMRPPHMPYPGQLLEPDGSNLARVLEATREVEREIYERVRRYFSVVTESVELLGVSKVGGYETVQFQVTRSGHLQPLRFDAASMSDGTLRALAALVAAFQNVVPYGPPSLVAIEEPETSLHPAAMRALVDALDEATLRTQILLSTHSAEMLDNPTIRPENIRVVQMIDGQTVIAQVDEASVEIVKRKLNTLGGLERDNQLEPDSDDLERQRRLSANGSEPPK